MSTIDPIKITNYKRKIYDLEKFLIFSVCVAGKNAQRTAKAVDILLETTKGSPFNKVKNMIKQKKLISGLKKSGIGQYTRLSKCLKEIINSNINLKTITAENLEKIHGIGPKTSRFFILHSRSNQRYAVLDTHILKYLNKLGYIVPKSTPSGKRYIEIEKIFLNLADVSNMTPAELDLAIWTIGNKGEL